MNTDRIVYNNLEQDTSTDSNDSQIMGGRTMSDLFAFTAAQRFAGPGFTFQTRDCSVGLDLLSDGGNDATIGFGVLLQISAAWPAALGPLDTENRVGFCRTQIPVTLPVAPVGTYHLLEMRVLDVTTVTQNRDVFVPGPQTFGPVLLPKQQERQVEFQWTTGSLVALPAPTAGWVSMFYYRSFSAVAAPLNFDFLTDLRNSVGDGVDRSEMGSFPADPVVFDNTFRTVEPPSPTGGNGLQVYGRPVGRVDGRTFRFTSNSLVNFPPVIKDTPYASPLGALVHLYLCPTKGVIPRFVNAAVEYVHRSGILVLSSVPPKDDGGRTNSAALTLPAPYTGVWAAVAANKALHVASLFTDAAVVDQFLWLDQDAGGQAIFGARSLLNPAAAAPLASYAISTAVLDANVPRNARSIRLLITSKCGGTTGIGSLIGVTYSPTAQFIGLVQFADMAERNSGYVDVPLHDPPNVSGITLVPTFTGAAGSLFELNVQLVGWSL